MKTLIQILTLFIALNLSAQSAFVDKSPNNELMTIGLNKTQDSVIVSTKYGLVSFEIQNSYYHIKIDTNEKHLAFGVNSLNNGPYNIYVRYKSGEYLAKKALVNIANMKFLKCPCK